MSVEINKQVVQQFCDALNGGDLETAMTMLAPGASWWIPTDRPGGMAMTKEQMAGPTRAFLACFQTLPKMEQLSITAEDDRVCVEQFSRGGVTRGGNTYGNDYHMFFRLRDGKIVEVKEYMNPIMAGPVVAELQGAKA